MQSYFISFSDNSVSAGGRTFLPAARSAYLAEHNPIKFGLPRFYLCFLNAASLSFFFAINCYQNFFFQEQPVHCIQLIRSREEQIITMYASKPSQTPKKSSIRTILLTLICIGLCPLVKCPPQTYLGLWFIIFIHPYLYFSANFLLFYQFFSPPCTPQQSFSDDNGFFSRLCSFSYLPPLSVQNICVCDVFRGQLTSLCACLTFPL